MYCSDNEAMVKILEAVLNSDNRANEVGVRRWRKAYYLSECHLDDFYIGSLSLVVRAVEVCEA